MEHFPFNLDAWKSQETLAFSGLLRPEDGLELGHLRNPFALELS